MYVYIYKFIYVYTRIILLDIILNTKFKTYYCFCITSYVSIYCFKTDISVNFHIM